MSNIRDQSTNPEERQNLKNQIMNLNEILRTEAKLTLSVSAADLKNFALVIIKETKEQMEATIRAETEERYLSPTGTAKKLGVDRSTLWRWKKRRYLLPVYIGGKPRYKLSDINQLLNNEEHNNE